MNWIPPVWPIIDCTHALMDRIRFLRFVWTWVDTHAARRHGNHWPIRGAGSWLWTRVLLVPAGGRQGRGQAGVIRQRKIIWHDGNCSPHSSWVGAGGVLCVCVWIEMPGCMSYFKPFTFLNGNGSGVLWTEIREDRFIYLFSALIFIPLVERERALPNKALPFDLFSYRLRHFIFSLNISRFLRERRVDWFE